MAKIVHHKIPRTTPHASDNDYRTSGLRILARMIAKVYLRDSQLKDKKNNSDRESKTR